MEAAYSQFKAAIQRHCSPPDSEWLFYKSHMHPRVFKKGEFFLQPGEPSSDAATLWRSIPARQYIQAVVDVECLVTTPGLLQMLRDRNDRQ